MIPFYSLVPVFGISISEQPKIYFNHRNTLISLLSNTLNDGSGVISEIFRRNLGLGASALLNAATGIATAYGHVFIPAIIGGEEKKFMLQWMTVGIDQAKDDKMSRKIVNWNTPFPNDCITVVT